MDTLLHATLKRELWLPAKMMQIMTYNVRYANDGIRKVRHWANRLPLMAEHIRRPSIVGLQEVMPSQLADIREAMEGYASIGAGRIDGTQGGEHVPIFYKKDQWEEADGGHFWLSATPETPGSRTWGNRIPRMCTWARLIDRKSGCGIYIYNTHFDHLSWKSRRLSAQFLLDTINGREHPSDPVALMGDLNCKPGSTPMKLLLADKTVLLDSFTMNDPDLANSSTFNRWRMSKRGRRKIDYILVSPNLKVMDSEILCIGQDAIAASDHNAVVITVDWP
ncbi:endonuclease [Oceaniferula spumae]|uniref:Endonuclease n=1 Tax=Oceaniferula spumae TaxID=2979115 RepID=A0AAT9FKJ3_9BACT